MNRLKLPVIFLGLALGLLTTGCDTTKGLTDSIFGKPAKTPLAGERLSVMKAETVLQPDADAQKTTILMPDPLSNKAWPPAENTTGQFAGNLALSANPRHIWTTGVGSGAGKRTRMVASPVVAEGHVYSLDTQSALHATDAQSGQSLWTVDLTPEGESEGSQAGGIAFDQGHLAVGTGFAEVLVLEASSGKILWRKHISAPVRGNPILADGRLLVLTVDNQLLALSAEDGSPLWTHTGLAEAAGVMGSVSPTLSGDTVVVPYSSGEIYALKVQNGRVAWMDSLASLIGGSALTNLADIRSAPVIDRGFVFAVSHSGRMGVIDERMGARVWSQSIGGINTPWVAGNMVYVLSTDNQLVALTRQEGHVRWVARLTEDDNKEHILISGPIIGGGVLWVTTSDGHLLGIDPDTGKQVKDLDLPGGTSQPPIIANETLYVLTDSAELAAYR